MRTENYRDTVAQSPIEFAGLVAVLQREGVKSFLEIGSRWGGSMWRIANALPPGSKVVSVDSGMGGGGRGDPALASLRACIAELKARGYDAHLIEGDSQKPDIVRRAKELGPYDAVFIDGDHSLKGVTNDWQNYGNARVVAFHDCAWKTPPLKPGKLPAVPVEVPELWGKLKVQYRSEEFVDPALNMGIGVLWRY